MIVTLAGHVDHGKTAVVQALTGTNTDRLKEEQERGLTIDLGFAYTNFQSQRVGFVDVPGHHRFLHNMIAGVASQQHALLVIAADDGIMPQTIEHTQILELLGIRTGTIVLNKVDLLDAQQVKQRHEQIRSFASDYFLKDALIFEVVATERLGVRELESHLTTTALTFSREAMVQPFRMPIDRSFSLQGVGTIVTGTIASGQVEVGADVHLTATGEPIRVRSLNVQGEEAEAAHAGDRCSLNLAGSASRSAKRGDWLLENHYDLPMTNALIDLSVLGDFPRKIKHWSSVHVYHLTDHSEARLSLLEQSPIEPGEKTMASLTCERSMHFKEGDRLILRDRDLSRTIGGATVLSHERIQSRRIFRTNQPFFESLRNSLNSKQNNATLGLRSAHDLVNVDVYRRFSLISQSQIENALETDDVIHASGQVLSSRLFERYEMDILQSLKNYHAEFPREEGATIEELTKRLNIAIESIQFTLGVLNERSKTRSLGGRYALQDHVAAAASYDQKLLAKVQPMFDAPQPVSLGDVAKRLNMPFHQIERSMGSLVHAGVLVQINKNRYLTPERLNQLQQLVTTLAREKPFTVREFRDVSGLGRNTVIDLLEYFDRQRLTQRRGDARVLINQLN